MAYTDALSIACKSLGIGHDIWFSNDRTKYTMPNSDVPEVKPVKQEAKQEAKPAAEHTPDTAAVINEIATRLAEVGKTMTSEEKRKLTDEVIVPTIGMAQFRMCSDIDKLIALRDKLCA